MGERDEADRTERPADGPGRGEAGRGGDRGRTSQDQPGRGSGTTGSGADADPPEHDPERPEDTNERADARAHVVEPGSGKESPRAES